MYGDTKLVKETPYAAKLTVASSENLELLTGDVFMSDGSETPATQTPYKLVTTDIESVETLVTLSNANDWSDNGANYAGNIDRAFDGIFNGTSYANPVVIDPGSGISATLGTVDFNISFTSQCVVHYVMDDTFNRNGGAYMRVVTAQGEQEIPIGSNTQGISNIRTITFDSTHSPITGLRSRRTTGSFGTQGFSGIVADGVVITDDTTLTFPGDVSTNPDLQYFKAGDVVASEAITTAVSFSALSGGTMENSDKPFCSDGTNDFNNVAWTSGAENNYPNYGGMWTMNVPYTNKVEIVVWQRLNAQTFKVNGVDVSDLVTEVNAAGANPTNPMRVDVTSKLNSNNKVLNSVYCERSNQGTATVHAIYVDGKRIYSNGCSLVPDTDVKVISTGYPDSNTMVVDGGNWDASNQSQVWSDLVVGSLDTNYGSGDAATAFNGDIGETPDQGLRPASGSGGNDPSGTYLSMNFGTTFQNATKVKLYGYVSLVGDNNINLRINGSLVTWNQSSAGPSVFASSEFTVSGFTTLEWSYQYTNASGYLYLTAIEVDGKLLVDAVNDSQIWSNGTSVEGYQGTSTIDKAFDGNSSTYAQRDNAAGTTVYTFTDPVPVTSSVTFKAMAENVSSEVYLTGPNGNSTPVSGTGSDGVEVSGDVASEIGSAIYSVTLVGISSATTRLYEIRVDGKLLVDTGARDFGDTYVEYQTNGGQGSIIEVNTTDNTLLVTNSGDGDNRWIADNYGEGSGTSTDFYVAPASAVPITQDYAWGKLQIVNNKAQVTGIQKDDPGFLPVPAKDYSIKFPAVFPTGNEPDVDIPRGACVAAIVAAENSEGRSVKESNCFMPADVNPEGAAGPITESTPTTLTLASNANLGDFSPGDELVMVNEDNVISSYTMHQVIESVDKIINIERNDAPQNWVGMTTQAGTIYPGDGGIDKLFDGTNATCGPAQNSTVEFIPSTPIPIKKSLRFKGAKSNPAQGAINLKSMAFKQQVTGQHQVLLLPMLVLG